MIPESENDLSWIREGWKGLRFDKASYCFPSFPMLGPDRQLVSFVHVIIPPSPISKPHGPMKEVGRGVFWGLFTLIALSLSLSYKTWLPVQEGKKGTRVLRRKHSTENDRAKGEKCWRWCRRFDDVQAVTAKVLHILRSHPKCSGVSVLRIWR